MALKILSSLASWGLCLVVLVLAIKPAQGTFGFSSWFGRPFRGLVGPAPEKVGLCAASIIPHGYQCQENYVTTEDGYILNVQRITQGRSGSSGGDDNNKQPVLLQHGVMADGMTWLMNSPEQNLPMILADNGFDVWIANSRGTRFSRRHTSIDPSSSDFWKWSWDELTTYELPAVVGHIYKETGQKVDYVGHSLGTLVVLAALSERRLVNQLNSVALLTPIAYLSHITTELGVLSARSFLGELTTLFGLAEFNPREQHASNFMSALCGYPGIDCANLLTSFTGDNCCLNGTAVSLFIKNEPQSTSSRNMVHLSQNVRTGVLAKYNYGRWSYNLFHYRKLSPPVYDLSNIPNDFPMFMSYGGRDALADPADVAVLLYKLKNHDRDKLTVQFVKKYAHIDFIMAVNAKDIVYNPLLSFLKRQRG